MDMKVIILPSFSQYGSPPLQHGSRPMPPVPDSWEQSHQQQQPPRGPYSHAGQLKRPAPPLGEHSVIQHTPLSLSRPNEDCPSPSKRKRSSDLEQVGSTVEVDQSKNSSVV